jgi:ribose-phosphate pyrophosphokinase
MIEPIVSIFSGRATSYLAEKVVEAYGTTLGKSEVIEFSDGEFQTSYEENIRGRDVFIIQSTVPPADNIWELLMMIDAAKRASARKIVAVIPYFGYARQDRKDKPRVSIGAKMVTNLLTTTGIDRLITLDLHADQIQGFMDIPVDNLYASVIFYPYLKSLKLKNLMMASPDTGGTRRAASYAKALNTGFAICYKQRTKPNVVEKMQLIGDVVGKDVVLVDDIIDTAGTITKAARVIMEKGANSVRALVTHPLFSGNAYDIIADSPFSEVIVSDTIPIKQNPNNKIKVITTATLFAEVIKRVENFESISSLFNLGDPNAK